MPQEYKNIPISQTNYAIINNPTALEKIKIQGLAILAGGTANSITFYSKGATHTQSAISATFSCAANGGLVLPFNECGWFKSFAGQSITANTSSGSIFAAQVIYDTEL